ncbi:MAG: type II toxin-antitoxin system RelE/ParE family toxin [Candidatus Omnitrophica bacterium]|nr:type II toxin-antitoxin system RelE/ParE family toxin [Candidatus Omnitrophota bacterium]
MAKYKIEVKNSAVKELKFLPKKDLGKILKKIESLADNPRPVDSKKMTNDEKYRMRYGTYRILYSIEDDILTVYIVKIAHRKDVYR